MHGLAPSLAPSPTDADLDGFRAAQRLAYQCAEEVARDLVPGVTEREAAARMTTWLADHGVREWFHRPFAWFAERAAFRGLRTPLDFFPTRRRLEEGTPFILDCAPVVGGYAADIGYAASLGPAPILDRLMADLAEHRALILRLARERRPLRAIYEAVGALAMRQGHDVRHSEYPAGVLAHQVWRAPEGRPLPTVGGFGLRTLQGFAQRLWAGRAEGWSPLWGGGARSDHPPAPGLWAVEPHLAFRGVGAKFEELLVVTGDEVYWLDDDLPHVRAWAAAGIGPRGEEAA